MGVKPTLFRVGYKPTAKYINLNVVIDMVVMMPPRVSSTKTSINFQFVEAHTL